MDKALSLNSCKERQIHIHTHPNLQAQTLPRHRLGPRGLKGEASWRRGLQRTGNYLHGRQEFQAEGRA